jgi:enamine deaminase RidA (YjgF/YER057c/UK114 family)
MSYDTRVAELGLELPPAPKPVGVYRPLLIQGNLAYLSGHGPLQTDGSLMMGCVGRNADLAVAQAAARQTGLALLATLRGHLGSLDRVERLVKLFGMVNCVAEFQQHPAVINGCSELLAAVFGSDRGVGARSAIGVVSLPAGMLVEIEAVFQLRED